VTTARVLGLVVVGHAVAVAGTGDHGIEAVIGERHEGRITDDGPGVRCSPLRLDLDTDRVMGQLVHRSDPSKGIKDPEPIVLTQDIGDSFESRR